MGRVIGWVICLGMARRMGRRMGRPVSHDESDVEVVQIAQPICRATQAASPAHSATSTSASNRCGRPSALAGVP